jgi:hypothetical protein
MSPSKVGTETATKPLRAPPIDMKLEVVVIPVSNVDRARASMPASVGGSTPTLSPARPFVSYSSRLLARRVR